MYFGENNLLCSLSIESEEARQIRQYHLEKRKHYAQQADREMGYLPPTQPEHHSNLYQPQYNNPYSTTGAATATAGGVYDPNSNTSLQSSNR